MNTVKRFFNGLVHKEEGQALPEYALLIFFVALVAIAAVTLLGTNVTALLNKLATAL